MKSGITFTWEGMEQAKAEASDGTSKIFSHDADINSNLFIEGDNLDVLKILNAQKYQPDLVYIDPPYNTGKSTYSYKNNFTSSAQFLNHLYPRLLLIKRILKPSSTLAVSISQHELGPLIMLMRGLFEGREIKIVTVEHNPRGQQSRTLAVSNEFIVFAVPSCNSVYYAQKDHDSVLVSFRRWGTGSERTSENTFYPIYVSNDGTITGAGEPCPDSFHPAGQLVETESGYAIYPIDSSGIERRWRYARDNFGNVLSSLKALRTQSGFDICMHKCKKTYTTVWTGPKYDASVYGSHLLNQLVPDSCFTYPKSVYTVYDVLHAVTKDNPNARILDCYAGSATTGHAVMMLNALDNGNRKFCLIQTPYDTDGKATIKTAHKRLEAVRKQHEQDMTVFCDMSYTTVRLEDV